MDSRLITVNRRVISYEPVEVRLVDFLEDSHVDLIPMKETKSLEIRLPTKYGDYSNYVGNISYTHLIYPLEVAINHIRNQNIMKVIRDHQHVIVVHDSIIGSVKVNICMNMK